MVAAIDLCLTLPTPGKSLRWLKTFAARANIARPFEVIGREKDGHVGAILLLDRCFRDFSMIRGESWQGRPSNWVHEYNNFCWNPARSCQPTTLGVSWPKDHRTKCLRSQGHGSDRVPPCHVCVMPLGQA